MTSVIRKQAWAWEQVLQCKQLWRDVGVAVCNKVWMWAWFRIVRGWKYVTSVGKWAWFVQGVTSANRDGLWAWFGNCGIGSGVSNQRRQMGVVKGQKQAGGHGCALGL